MLAHVNEAAYGLLNLICGCIKKRSDEIRYELVHNITKLITVLADILREITVGKYRNRH